METCVGCGLTVEIDAPVFLDWEAVLVGHVTCPDCRVATDEDVKGEHPVVVLHQEAA